MDKVRLFEISFRGAGLLNALIKGGMNMEKALKAFGFVITFSILMAVAIVIATS